MSAPTFKDNAANSAAITGEPMTITPANVDFEWLTKDILCTEPCDLVVMTEEGVTRTLTLTAGHHPYKVRRVVSTTAGIITVAF
ncbi:MAG: hypothetical protein ACRBC3_19655 [Burkholderiaceae bacterium]